MEEQNLTEKQTPQVQAETEVIEGDMQPVGDDQQDDIIDEPLRFEIEIPKKVDNGEDAPPLFMDLNVSEEGPSETTSVLLGVFDGMGGAGSQPVTLPNGIQKTNAYVGSRTTRQLVESFFSTLKTTQEPIEQQLENYIQNGLCKKNSELEALGPSVKSKLISTIHQKLPTTMALLLCQHQEGRPTLQLTTLWAGDSRCYTLLPKNGLHQLTKDDNHSLNALDALRKSPPMTNYISASHDFTINRRDYKIELPCLLFSASDGVFDYFPSPLLLEYNILHTLQQSSSVTDWKNRLQTVLDAWKQDDVTMAMTALGFSDFNKIKESFSTRYEWLKTSYKDIISMADNCTQVLLQEKNLRVQMADYRERKQAIEINIQSIEAELKILSQKMGEIQKLIDDYRQQIISLEGQIQSEEDVNLKYKQEIDDKETEKGNKEEEKAPWEEKIAELEQSIKELNSDSLKIKLGIESEKTWVEYQSSYEEMLNGQPEKDPPFFENDQENNTKPQDLNNNNVKL